MSREQFIEKRFNESTKILIAKAIAILDEYVAEGYVMTLRQLYYQLVSRDIIPNNLKSYKRLGSALSDARLAGLVDWDAMEDRVRSLETINNWPHPRNILEASAEQFRLDMWLTQPYRVEVWVEKDALTGVMERACEPRRVPYFACRGYTSQSAQYRASKRFQSYIEDGYDVLILHLGDHDPSGIDMTRDNTDRLETFLKPFGSSIEFRRIALSYAQVKKYKPPTNPVKFKDSRAADYEKNYGKFSWELDALDPRVLTALIAEHVEPLIDEDAWEKMLRKETSARKKLDKVAKNARKWKN